MATRSSITTVLALGFAVILAGCSVGSTSSSGSGPTAGAPSPAPSASTAGSPSPGSSGTSSADGLLLKVTHEGGLIAPGSNLAALPTVAVYSDGRIFTPAAVPAIYPGPLLQSFQVRDVGPAGAAAIEDAMRVAGLDAPVETDPGVIGDAGTMVVTAVLDGNTTTVRYPGSGAGGRPDMSGSNPAAEAVLALLDRLNDPTDTWGGAAGAQSIYEPEGYLIFVAPGAPAADQQLTQRPMTWPLDPPLSEFGTPVPDAGIEGLRSGVVLGEEAASLTPFLEAANGLTPIVSGDRAYTLSVRPLLPDEVAGG